MRNGRYVVPVKADFRGEFQGIVHDLSSSGATVFMEPIAAVALGNKWRESQLAEEREVERVLRELSTLVGDYAPEIETMVTVLAQLDLVLAKAKYGVQVRGIAPGFRREGDPSRVLKLERARHPCCAAMQFPSLLSWAQTSLFWSSPGPTPAARPLP